MEYVDEKWKLSKEDHWSSDTSNIHSPSYKSSSLIRSIALKSSTSKSPPLLRSFSKSSSFKSSSLSRSSSQKNPTSRSSSLSRSCSQKCSNFTHKCSTLAKEQRARFYIVKRCITLLVCWHKHGDS